MTTFRALSAEIPRTAEAAGHNVRIATIDASVKDDWLPLFASYRAFYDANTDPEQLMVVWGWLMDKARNFEGILIYIDKEPAAFALFGECINAVDSQIMGFLHDLYVADEYRGLDLGIRAVLEISHVMKARGWERIWWITDDNNFAAKRAYDKIAHRTMWTTYVITFNDTDH